MTMESSSAVAPSLKVKLIVGDLAVIEGLKVAELNGQQGQLLRQDLETSRWEVKFPDGEVKAIKAENLCFRGILPVEDDGTLALVGLASDHSVIQRIVKLLGDEFAFAASEALTLSGHVIMNGNVSGEEARIWQKLADQAEKKVRSAAEDLQKYVESLDSVENFPSSKAGNEFRVARKDLIRFIQSSQGQLESALLRLRPVMKLLTKAVPKRTGWSTDDALPLHEKYRAAFEKLSEGAEAAQKEQAKVSGLAPIVVKYQGKGENPPPSDNLYIKGLPGWVTEEDLQAMMKEAGAVQSMKLKSADWGAICFVRMANRIEAARAIQLFNGTVPSCLVKQGKEKEALSTAETRPTGKAALRGTIEQLARGVLVVVKLRKPLGILFGDDLVAKSVQAGSQAAAGGVRAGWRARSIGGWELHSIEELKERIATLRTQGLKQAVIAFSPPALVVTFPERPFGLVLGKDPELGLIFVNEAAGNAHVLGVRPGAVISAVAGKDVTGMEYEDVTMLLRESELPAVVVFEQAVPEPGSAEPVKILDDSDTEKDSPNIPITAASVQLLDDSIELTVQAEVEERPLELKKLTLDLNEPLGVGFNDILEAKEVRPGSQADRLGIRVGWKAHMLAGKVVKSTKEFVALLKRLKEDSEQETSATFSAPSEEAQEAAPEVQTFELNLAEPLGVGFSDGLRVKEVKAGSQGASLGVCIGWKLLSIGDEKLASTKELVARVKALKAGNGETKVPICFEVSDAEPPAKRLKSSP